MQIDEQNTAAFRNDSTVPVPAALTDARRDVMRRPSAIVIVNADDWGRAAQTTDRTLDCFLGGVISSVSAMVFMEDSERAASLVREHNIDAGLHLNVTSTFTGPECPSLLMEHQQRISRVMTSNRMASAIYHPLLAGSFEYVVKTQLEEFERIYGVAPSRIDGHHHMHLCANVILQKLLPKGVIVRRNFSFAPGEKSLSNRLYRGMQDRLLAARHPITDLFFNLAPLDRSRLERILDLANHFNIEVETHPSNDEEYNFLVHGGLQRVGAGAATSRGYFLRSPESLSGGDHGYIKPKCETAYEDLAEGAGSQRISVASEQKPPHIAVCICTYKRPFMLKRLLTDLNLQDSAGLFTYSVVVADNDEARSAEAVVAEIQSKSAIPLKYCVEPKRGIAMARNKVIANADGDFVALIDDDEFPTRDWLLNLFKASQRYDVDGVLGPVKRHFDERPPEWLKRSRLYDRAVNATGTQLSWRQSRTGNVLLRKEILSGDPAPFRPEFKAGEDRDFFRRKIAEGRVFVWSAQAAVFEVIPPPRWKRMYYVRKALLQGATFTLQPSCTPLRILKSVIAVPLYTLGLPLALLAGQHHFMTLLVKLCDHAGKLLFLMHINPIREEYVSE